MTDAMREWPALFSTTPALAPIHMPRPCAGPRTEAQKSNVPWRGPHLAITMTSSSSVALEVLIWRRQSYNLASRCFSSLWTRQNPMPWECRVPQCSESEVLIKRKTIAEEFGHITFDWHWQLVEAWSPGAVVLTIKVLAMLHQVHCVAHLSRSLMDKRCGIQGMAVEAALGDGVPQVHAKQFQVGFVQRIEGSIHLVQSLLKQGTSRAQLLQETSQGSTIHDQHAKCASVSFLAS